MYCRRCNSNRLLELVRLDGADHTVYRCRDCGFLFSPPEQDVPDADRQNIAPSLPPESPDAARRRMLAVAAVRRRPASAR